MELSATKRIEGLGNVFEILQEEKKNPTFYFSTAVLEHVLSDKSSSLLQDAIWMGILEKEGIGVAWDEKSEEFCWQYMLKYIWQSH